MERLLSGKYRKKSTINAAVVHLISLTTAPARLKTKKKIKLNLHVIVL